MAIFSSILPDFSGYTLKSATVHLQFTRKIGTGAYGIVYLAQDLTSPPSDPRVYAVKCMLKFEQGSELETMQLREIAYHRSLSYHPNVTKLLCVIEEQHYVFLVMDYYEGGDLFSAVIDRQSFAGDDDRVKTGFVQMLDAVDACHEQGVFHRDLKPENILCSTDDSRFFLSDFGLATQLEVSSSLRCGSSFYMSPECIGYAAQPYSYSTRQSDVWSLGVILVNMLSGRNPWRTASIDDDGFCMYLKDPTHFLHQILPMISTYAVEILARIFDPDPITRVAIPELRRLVLNASTFFSHSEDCAEIFNLLTDDLPQPVKDNVSVTAVDVEMCCPASDDTASSAAFVSICIRTPSSEPAAGMAYPQSSEHDIGQSGTNTLCTDSLVSCAQAAPGCEDRYVRRVDGCVRKDDAHGARVPWTVHRIMGVFHRRTARA